MSEKLVRDRIAEIYARRGDDRGTYRDARTDERWGLLVAKLREEVDEFVEAPSSDELADVLEVVYALADEMTLSRDLLEQTRAAKAQARGAFSAMTVWIEPREGMG